MKKALKIVGIIVALFIVAIIVLPIVFKGKIVELIKQEANKNLNAVVDFSDVDLSLIRNFPNLAVSIENMSVIGIAPFEGDTLAYMESLNLSLDIMSVISGDQIKIKNISLESPNINVLVLEDGTANYDIAIASDEETAEVDTTASEPISLSIKEYSISNGRIIYDDKSLGMVLKFVGMNHTGRGDFEQDVFTLYTETGIDQLSVVYDGVGYINNANTKLDADIAMDLNNMKFTFMENELSINRLALGFDGWLAMPGDDIDMDISFNAKKNDLTTILSLVPAEFASDLDGVDAAGTVGLSGFVRGVYNDSSMPGFNVKLNVDNGRVQYPDLPRSINNINIAAEIAAPEGDDLDLLTVDVPTFHMEIGKSATDPNTIDARLSLRRPMTDPLIDTRVDADLNLGSFKDVVPMKGELELAGNLSAHFELNGALSAIEAQQFNNFKAEGAAQLDNFVYRDSAVAAAIPEAKMSFSPQRLTVETFKVVYEEINMAIDGYLNNYVAYALTDTTLQGVFNFTADKINANKFMTETESSPSDSVQVEAAPDTSGIFLVPGNLDVVLNANIGEILYDDMVLSNMNGQIAIKNEIASLNNLNFATLGGTIRMDGSYSTQNPEVPKADFSYVINSVGISETAQAFNTVEKLAPIAKNAQGEVSSTLSLKMDLNQAMEPIYETMNGRGTISTDEVILEGGKFLQKLSTTLKSPKLARQVIKDLNATFVIENGKIITEPFDVKIDNMTATVSGYSSFDETIDYMMKMKIPRNELGGEFNQMAEGLMAQANAFLGGNMSLGEFINVNVRIHGDLYDPTVTPSFAGMEGGSVKDQAKEAIKEVIDEKIDEGKEKAREEAIKQAEKILADAQKQADQVVKEAEKAAAQIRSEAAKQGKKLVDDAGNPLAKQAARLAADKLNKEADKQADNLVAEAQKQANKIMADARAQADKLKAE